MTKQWLRENPTSRFRHDARLAAHIEKRGPSCELSRHLRARHGLATADRRQRRAQRLPTLSSHNDTFVITWTPNFDLKP